MEHVGLARLPSSALEVGLADGAPRRGGSRSHTRAPWWPRPSLGWATDEERGAYVYFAVPHAR